MLSKWFTNLIISLLRLQFRVEKSLLERDWEGAADRQASIRLILT